MGLGVGMRVGTGDGAGDGENVSTETLSTLTLPRPTAHGYTIVQLYNRSGDATRLAALFPHVRIRSFVEETVVDYCSF